MRRLTVNWPISRVRSTVVTLLALLLCGLSTNACCSTKDSQRPTVVVTDPSEIQKVKCPDDPLKTCWLVSDGWMLRRLTEFQALKAALEQCRESE